MTRPAGWYSVLDTGAEGDGVTNDTLAIQSAIDTCTGLGGGEVVFPPGRYLTDTLYLHGNCILMGYGTAVSTLLAARPDGDVVVCDGGGNRLTDLGFDCATPRESGSYVNFTSQCERSCLDNFLMRRAYTGVTLSGPDTLYVEHGIIKETSTKAGSCGVLVNGGQDQYISKITMNHEPDRQPSAGICIQNTGNCTIADVDLIHCGVALSITGGFSIYVRDSFFDSSQIGIMLSAYHPIERCHFSGCWSSGHKQHGVFLDPASIAAIDAISFVQHDALYNSMDGIHFGKGTALKLIASNCCQNKAAGLALGHLASKVLVQGNKIGSTKDMIGNLYGVFLVAGADYLLLTGNDLTGNQQALAGACANQVVRDNFGV